MVTQINIDSQLGPSWPAKIERQINFALSSVHWQVVNLAIDLKAAEGNATHPDRDPTYCCRLQAELRGGRKQEISVVSSNPQVCVADAAARLRRVVTRDRQLGLMGRAS
ncbi:MAG: hypothetical protein NXH95_20505 [Pseudomonadaceae bacterium]|nr:hypothetical protein [Pseudomonadaceae bacterium]